MKIFVMSADLMNQNVRRSSHLILALLAFQFSTFSQTVFSDKDAEAIKTFLRESFTNGNSGMVIGILDERGNRTFAAGKLDNGTDQEVNADTIFEIGSVTKVFTSLLALDMARRGEIKLDDPVAKYVPERVKVPAYEGKEQQRAVRAARRSVAVDPVSGYLFWGHTPKLSTGPIQRSDLNGKNIVTIAKASVILGRCCGSPQQARVLACGTNRAYPNVIDLRHVRRLQCPDISPAYAVHEWGSFTPT